jgi:hypothetical protein
MSLTREQVLDKAVLLMNAAGLEHTASIKEWTDTDAALRDRVQELELAIRRIYIESCVIVGEKNE